MEFDPSALRRAGVAQWQGSGPVPRPRRFESCRRLPVLHPKRRWRRAAFVKRRSRFDSDRGLQLPAYSNGRESGLRSRPVQVQIPPQAPARA